MKFGKPIYLADKKIYKSELIDGFRCEVTCEAGVLSPSLDVFLPQLKLPLTQTIVQNTKGWFSKPLTEGWLVEKIQILFPTMDLPIDFEGSLVWQAKELIISKENFVFHMELVEKKEVQKVVIDFPEEEPPKVQVRRKEPLSREELKKLVLKERGRAARALFRAERLTQEYCELYGDETDWEESDEESEN